MVGSWAVLKIKDSKLITKQLDLFAYILSTYVHFKMPGKQKLHKSEKKCHEVKKIVHGHEI